MSAAPEIKKVPRQVQLRLMVVRAAYDDATSEGGLDICVPFSRLCALFTGPRGMR